MNSFHGTCEKNMQDEKSTVISVLMTIMHEWYT